MPTLRLQAAVHASVSYSVLHSNVVIGAVCLFHSEITQNLFSCSRWELKCLCLIELVS